MVYFCKQLTQEILGEINEPIIAKARAEEEEPRNHDDDSEDNDHGNRGTMIVDVACAPPNIRYPQDTSLLNEARRVRRRSLKHYTYPEKGNLERIEGKPTRNT
jgi:hypothetical protein